MPVYRTPDGRIVEEKTTLQPRRDAPEPAVNGTAPGDDPDAAVEKRRGYTEPTVVRRPGSVSAGPAAGPEDERTRLAGAVPTDAAGSEEADPVTGWLMIVSGPGMGRDLRIGVGRNDLGRDRGNRIALPFDDRKISRRAGGSDGRAPGCGRRSCRSDSGQRDSGDNRDSGQTLMIGRRRPDVTRRESVQGGTGSVTN